MSIETIIQYRSTLLTGAPLRQSVEQAESDDRIAENSTWFLHDISTLTREEFIERFPRDARATEDVYEERRSLNAQIARSGLAESHTILVGQVRAAAIALDAPVSSIVSALNHLRMICAGVPLTQSA